MLCTMKILTMWWCKYKSETKGEFLNEDNTSKSPRCLRHYYDELGKGHYELTAC